MVALTPPVTFENLFLGVACLNFSGGRAGEWLRKEHILEERAQIECSWTKAAPFPQQRVIKDRPAQLEARAS